ncbi:hypothetical protein F5Y14DRAFT_625 [Nemania sp. NC0429]|nr:hypothetical protein F5Y14DRAFT_625 [Nemania sp. NC0429]
MADPIHEHFKSKFDIGLDRQLAKLAKRLPAVAHLINDLNLGGHSFVEKGEYDDKNSPDGQVTFGDVLDPSFIYKIAHSQSEVKLEKLVDHYFGQWPGRIGAVLGFKFSYNRCKDPNFEYTASVSLWTATVDEDGIIDQKHVSNQIFWQDGKAVAGALTLPLKLFIPPFMRQAVLLDNAENACLRWDFAEMGKWVVHAMKGQRLWEARLARRRATAQAPEEGATVKRRKTDLNGNTTLTKEPAAKRLQRSTRGT